MVAKRKPAPAAPEAPANAVFSVVLETREPKKHSSRFVTEKERPGISNVYVSNWVWEKIGSPDKVKLTIEPA